MKSSKTMLQEAANRLCLQLSKSIAGDIKAKMDIVINDLDWCVDALVRASGELCESDIQGSFSVVSLLEEIEDNLTARQLIKEETLDEIRKGSTDLRGEEAKESQDEQVEKME